MNFAKKPELTKGALAGILHGKNIDKPVLQVLNLKKIQSDVNSPDRYRLQMSDGDKHQPCMLATQMNPMVVSHELDKFCVVRVNRCICNTVHERRIIILVDISVLASGSDVGGIIGHPSLLDLVRADAVAPNSVSSTVHGSNGPAVNGHSNTRNGPPQKQSMNGPSKNPSSNSTNNFYSSKTPPSRPGGFERSPGVKFEGGSGGLSKQTIFPISSLSPYQSKWTIRVRVTSKPSIRTWSNSRGEGRIFSVDLVDESGEIRASAFNEVADKLHSIFELGKIYYVSRGRLKPANRQFNNLKNEYELSLGNDTEVEICTDSSCESSLPTLQYNFQKIAQIESIEPNSIIDVIGVCKSTADISSIITKTTNKKMNKRDIQLVDRSGCVVSCTLWGAEAEEFDGSGNPVIAIKGARVSDFGGRSLSTTMNGVMSVNPDIPEAHQLRGWYDSVGKNEDAPSISTQRMGGGSGTTPFLTFGQVKELDLGHSEKPDYFNVKAYISFAKKEGCLYKACPNQDCNKKVTEGSDGTEFLCEKCNQNFPNFKYRMILSINASDHTGSHWMTCFQDTGMEVLGVSAQELGEMDENEYDQVFQRVNFKEFVFKLRAKMDVFNDEQRLKCYCVAVSPMNFVTETKRLTEQIQMLMA